MADALRLSALRASLSPLAARWVAYRLAAILAEAHAREDEDGNPAPVLFGAGLPARVVLDVEGDITLGAEVPTAQEERIDGGRLTPRADVLALGRLLSRLVPAETVADDAELRDAIALANEPVVARRRITCVELEALLARSLDVAAAKQALADAVRSHRALEPEPLRSSVAPRASLSRPLAPIVRVGVALVTASVVYVAGIAVIERLAP